MSEHTGQIIPVRIVFFDELDFPVPPPALQPLLARNGVFDAAMLLEPDQPLDVILAGEARYLAVPVFHGPAQQVVGDVDIQRPWGLLASR